MMDRAALLDMAQQAGPDVILLGAISGDFYAATLGNVLRFELTKQSPQRLWNEAKANHPAIYRALKIDPNDPAAFYAAFPFRLAKVDGHYVVLTAFPPPPLAHENVNQWTHLDIAFVVAWEPLTGRYQLLGDTQPQVILPASCGDDEAIYGDFFAFARAWAERRAGFWQRRQEQIKDKWAHPLKEPCDGNLPGALAIGDPAKIRWPLADLPDLIKCIGLDRNAVNSAIFRQTRLPRVVEQRLRAAA